jgi:hypothetical protein
VNYHGQIISDPQILRDFSRWYALLENGHVAIAQAYWERRHRIRLARQSKIVRHEIAAALKISVSRVQQLENRADREWLNAEPSPFEKLMQRQELELAHEVSLSAGQALFAKLDRERRMEKFRRNPRAYATWWQISEIRERKRDLDLIKRVWPFGPLAIMNKHVQPA